MSSEMLDKLLLKNGGSVNPATRLAELPKPVTTPKTSPYSPRYALQDSYVARSAQAVYDTSYYGVDFTLPLELPGLTATSITFSQISQIRRNTDISFNPGGGAASYQWMVQNPGRIYTNADQGFILSNGSDTALNQNWAFPACHTAAVYQTRFCFAVGLNVSAFTSGSFNINSVDLQFQTFQNNNQPTPGNVSAPIRVFPSTAFTALTATGLQVFLIRFDIDRAALIEADFPLLFNIRANLTTGMGTFQCGIIPQFPLFTASGNKMLYDSQVQLHMLPLPQHIDEIRQYIDDFKIVSLTDGQSGGL